jgi:hypothetical protein
MKDINEFFAEKCDVLITTYNYHGFDLPAFIYKGVKEYKWTIQDPRCREIIRERFKVDTEYYEDIWYCTSHSDDAMLIQAAGKTIAESEINCITAIYEAMENEQND